VILRSTINPKTSTISTISPVNNENSSLLKKKDILVLWKKKKEEKIIFYLLTPQIIGTFENSPASKASWVCFKIFFPSIVGPHYYYFLNEFPIKIQNSKFKSNTDNMSPIIWSIPANNTGGLKNANLFIGTWRRHSKSRIGQSTTKLVWKFKNNKNSKKKKKKKKETFCKSVT